ncbi:MAG: histidine phosphatase family protein [Solirubrobacterales bacterium]|nr:histidine phosphatase family protein [Solirubrobacterales bacterium]
MRNPQRPFRLPPDSIEILFVRHGAAGVEAGPVDLFQGQCDHPLEPLGEEQAARAADRLAERDLAAIFTSPLRRTRQTAAPLAERTGADPVVVPGLREVHLGEWEAEHEFPSRVAARDPLIAELIRSERWDTIPGAESPETVAERVADAIAEIAGHVERGSTVAAYTHAGIVAEICRQATGSRPFAFLAAENASITRTVVDPDGRIRLLGYNDIGHLAG